MGYAIGTVTKGGGDDCHYQLLAAIKTLAEANGWTTLRYVNTGLVREWIGKGVGLSGTEEIFAGFRTYQDIGSDYYNLLAGVFIGYVAGAQFDEQPGARLSGIPAHNNALTYFLTANAQRIIVALKVGTPVYTHGYVGKMFPYARPGEYPSPLVCAGMFNGAEAKRFSDTAMRFPYAGQGYSAQCCLYLRSPDGNWNNVYCYPFSNANSTTNALAGPQGSNTLVPGATYYQIEPIIMQQVDTTLNPSNVYGELDGVMFCSGFNNGSEQVVQMGGSSVVNQTGLTPSQAIDAILAVGGRAFLMIQNVNLTSWCDFVALEFK